MTYSGGTTGTAVSGGTPLVGTAASDHKVNQLPLDSWRNVMGYHPWHFWGLQSTAVPVTSNCSSIVTKYSWQHADMAGRHEIRAAIATAEARLSEHLNYFVGRHFVSEELQYPRPAIAGHQFAASVGTDGRWLNVRMGEGYVRNIGVETRTTLDATAAVTYSDEDEDGVEETFTITVSVTTTDVDEIEVYFAATDRLDGAAVSEQWRIAPVNITIAGGVATIVGRKWLMVKPIKYEGLSTTIKDGLDLSTAANFVTEVAVYRRFCDPTGTTEGTCQALLVWETAPYPAWATWCDGSTTTPTFNPNALDPAGYAYGIARAQIRDARQGEVTIGRAVYNSTTGEWTGAAWGTCRQPDRVIVRYEAGARLGSVESTLSQSRIDGRWDEIVARYAASEMNRRICACDVANRELYRWQFDLARSAGANDEQYRISERDLQNPLGTRAGAVYAWNALMNLKVTRAFVL